MLTVKDVLDLAVVRAGAPEVLAGSSVLASPVRWVHVAELKSLAGLLEGGELVLTTGLAFEDSSAEAARYFGELAAAGAAGVVVEITAQRPQAEAALRQAAGEATLPVILLTRRIRFVEVTEVVHRMLVAGQLAQLERSRQVHEVFTMLSVENAPPEEIVARAAELIGSPVVLEDVAHLVLAFASAGVPASELLLGWAERSRLVHYREQTARAGDAGWLQTPVGLRGQRWGRLVVPAGSPTSGPAAADGDDAMVLERAGQALTINRMAERDQRELGHQARAGLLHELRRPGALEESEALARAAALGLSAAPVYLPVVFRLDRRPGEEPIEVQRRERALLDLLHSVLAAARVPALAASLQAGALGVLVAVPARQLEDPVLERLCGQLAEQTSVDWAVGVGRSRPDLLAAAAGLDEAAHVAESAAGLGSAAGSGSMAGTGSTAGPGGGRRFYRSADVRLRGLLSMLRDDPRAAAFAEAELAPISQDPEALDLLLRYVQSGGNKAQLARDGYFSRPTLYAKLAQLQDKLGVPLDDAESRTSLHVALLLHKLRG
ncbi:PucR family transcriptional regulator ligand-binding domain-containing protein [Arthrobacter sulfonylureivorans]|uniref:PucR family transcriptional regulator n=1 Tax=Arthrobacter sulfonylureivorans TaxID=2486855 RepID=UPI0039E2395E